MGKRLHRSIKLFCLLTLAFILITACYGKPSQNALYPKARLAASECRVVKHSLGEACVPLNPKRLIIMDEEALEAVLALGIKPLAAAEANWVGSRGRQFGTKAEGIVSLGKNEQPNLERMVQLHPDFILGMIVSPENYQLFSQIAPTVVLDYYEQNTWKEAFLHIGEVLGKSTQAQEVLTQYQKRVQEFQKAMGERLEKTEVTVSRFYAGGQQTEFRTPFSFPGSVFREIGLSLPEKQQELIKTGFRLPLFGLGLERVDLLDADALFVALDPRSEKNFKKYQSSKLWQQLKVVKNDRVYIVDSGYWIFGNILSANTILDDLYKYLLSKQ